MSMSSLEDLFGKLAMTTVNTVSRIAISHATNAAIRGVTAYITQQTSKDQKESRELTALQRRLDLKVKNLKPTIDIIARAVADGNQDLEPALELCNDLKRDIDEFAEEMNGHVDRSKKGTTTNDYIRLRLRQLLENVEDAVPSLHLALRSLESTAGTASNVSSSKLVQASSIIEAAKMQMDKVVFRLRLYSLFAANIRTTADDGTTPGMTWKEEFFKCDLVLKHSDPFHYELKITEDLNDGRYHEETKGRVLSIPVHRVERMYYTRSGALLNIEDSKAPVLVLKVLKEDRDDAASEEFQSSHLKVKEARPDIASNELQKADWFAVEMWTENDTNGSEQDDDEEDDNGDDNNNDKNEKEKGKSNATEAATTVDKTTMEFPTSLLLLESLLKLSLLEVTEQMSHLNASDELINLYMRNT